MTDTSKRLRTMSFLDLGEVENVMSEAASILEAQAKEISELREALKPFANVANVCDVEGDALLPDDYDMIAEGFVLISLPMARFRYARAKLEGSGE